ncbi:MAG: RNA-binding protein [Alphaproteobacteria bacterium]
MTKTATRKPEKTPAAAPEHDGTAAADRKTAETVRKCIVTGRTLPKERLIRFCVSPDGMVVPDLACRLPGRGIWVSADADAVRTAVTKNLFAKAAGGKVAYPDDLAGLTERLFEKRCRDLLGVTRKAGLVVSGFEKVVAALQKGRVAYLLEATDGAADGREKIVRLAKGIPVLEVMTGDEMAGALGRERCIHAALKPGAMTDVFVSEVRRRFEYAHKSLNVLNDEACSE